MKQRSNPETRLVNGVHLPYTDEVRMLEALAIIEICDDGTDTFGGLPVEPAAFIERPNNFDELLTFAEQELGRKKVLSWMTTRHPDLGHLMPVQIAMSGELSDIRKLARAMVGATPLHLVSVPQSPLDV